MVDSTIAAETIIQGNCEFAFDLYSRFVRAGKSNLFFSPYSISRCLAMAFAGARGRTEQEMASVLRFDAGQDEVHSVFAKVNEQIFSGSEDSCKLHFANRICGPSGYQPRDEFLELLRRNYGTDFEQMDFSRQSETARQSINQWVEEQTAGKITNLIQPGSLNELTRLLLVNAVYFNGEWTNKFDKDTTKRDSFHLGLFKKVNVQMMYQKAEFFYGTVGSIQILELPYGDQGLKMVILLPKRVGGLAKLESALSVRNMHKWLAAVSPQTVKVFLPKFRLEQEIELAEVLNAMGMRSAFSDTNADFSGMFAEKPGLCISKVLHKAFVEVNEEGTEAAAATAVIPVLSARFPRRPPRVPVFRADHPFVFMIRRGTNILFIGRFVNPEG